MNPAFTEFPESSYEQWKKLVTKELGDRPFESLLWQNPNGFAVEPYQVSSSMRIPADRPAAWEVYQSVKAGDAKTMNKLLLQSLMGGVNAIGIDMPVNSRQELEEILRDIRIEFISTHFEQVKNGEALLTWWMELCASRGIDTRTIKGSIAANPFGADAQKIAELARKNFSLFRVFTFQLNEIQDQGGEAIHELAAALSQGNAVMHHLRDSGFTPDEIAAMLQFNFATSSSYFTEIAKYRAFRHAWKTVVRAYEPTHACSERTFIHAATSRYQQTVQDPYNNLLRATTQAMSAVIGGVDSLHVLCHTANMDRQEEESLRLARNIQHLLTEESHLDKTGDIAAGSFYIEEMTAQVMNHAWDLFVEAEAVGFWPAGKSILDEKMEQAAAIRQQEIENLGRVIVGVNKYQDKKNVSAEHAVYPSMTSAARKA